MSAGISCPIDELHTVLDWMALHKLNTFHLHLTEDQGWRFEVKAWPRLTEIGSQRSESVVGHASHSSTYDGIPHGGFYTQDELRALVEFAAGRFIQIVPEVDLPGHTQAARAAYPELGYDEAEHQVMTTWGVSDHIMRVDEPGLAFAKDVVGELIDVFPSPFIHIGGDEVPKREWEASDIARRQLAELGLSDMDALQSWFTGQLAEFLESRGRRLVGWDEILEGGDLPPERRGDELARHGARTRGRAARPRRGDVEPEPHLLRLPARRSGGRTTLDRRQVDAGDGMGVRADTGRAHGRRGAAHSRRPGPALARVHA